jgi:plasmid stabilization system protein ParE
MAHIYKGFENAANNPHRDESRFDRSTPFSMQPAGVNHFVIYHRFEDHIVIGVVFAQEMDIERQISRLKSRLAHEIEAMHAEIKKRVADKGE